MLQSFARRYGRVFAGFLFASTALLLATPLASMEASVAANSASPLRIQGSTTFNGELIKPNRAKVDRLFGQPVDIVANKSSWGLLALLDGNADMAMISAPLDAEISAARQLKPAHTFEDLEEFRIKTTRIVFAVNPKNPVSVLPLATVRKIFTGEITNWSMVGGPDLPILVVAVKEGGGTLVAVRAKMLGDAQLAPGAIRLESAQHLLTVVAQERGAIGIAQRGLALKAGLDEIATETPIEQPLSLITRGRPTARMERIIEVLRSIAEDAQ
jgi:phosphate transport system substrate-binding protein